MRHQRVPLLVLSLVVLLVLGAACQDDDDGEGPVAGAFLAQLAARSGQQAGIQVPGAGTVLAEPDQATTMVGVEVRDRTVALARSRAASAMEAVIGVLTAQGVAERDIQTRRFRISPQYSFQDRVQLEGVRSREQVLTGYLVTNQAAIVVRELDRMGAIVDAMAAAGGDLTRIQGITFGIADPAPLQAQAREAAVQDALGKAQEYAKLAGVTLGRLVYLAETGGTPAAPVAVARAEMAISASTPISAGELAVEVRVLAVFAIE